uniref:Uncharacterized protein n=1 Tax=Micrurus corallinus TaxID=54390 RepID=A0A2D4G004_MICCO
MQLSFCGILENTHLPLFRYIVLAQNLHLGNMEVRKEFHLEYRLTLLNKQKMENTLIICIQPAVKSKCLNQKEQTENKKTDREKMEKRTAHEKEKYQPSYDTTILTE